MDDRKQDNRLQYDSSLAMAYVPWQQWRELYTPEVGFKRGTIFSELDKPFIGEEAVCDD